MRHPRITMDKSNAATRAAPRDPGRRSGLYRWAAFCVGFCVFLLLAGANVRTQRAGLTVPDWPLIYGELLPDWDKLKELYRIDTLRAEVMHRHIASLMGLLTLVLAVWVQRCDPRSWVRKTAWAAFGLVVVQGVFGGLGVLFQLAAPWPLLHSVFAQLFLCTLVALATFLSPRWRTDEDWPLDATGLAVVRGAALAGLAVFAQLILGAAARHGYLAREVHSMFALLVVILLAKLVVTAAGDVPRELTRLRRPSLWLGAFVVAQVGLGLASYLIATERAQHVAAGYQDLPALGEIVILNLHLVLGAVVLALCVALLFRGLRIYGLPTDERVREARGRIAAATATETQTELEAVS